MGSNAFIALVENVTFLLALVFVFDISYAHPLNLSAKYRPYSVGLGLGLITVAAMSVPWVFAPGIVFDTRSVLIGISGMFFGTIPTLIAMTAAAGYRVWQGGAAAFTGVCVIVASGLIGLAWRRVFKRSIAALTMRDLLGLGYAVHVTMLALMFTLPWQTAVRVVSHIALPVLTIYPLGTAALGMLILNRLRREQTAAAVRENEAQFRALSEQAAIGVTKTETSTGRFIFVNQRFADIVGYARDELLTMTFKVLTEPDDLTEDLNNVDRLVKGELTKYSMEKRYRRKDGKVIWVNLTVSPLWQAGESPQYLIGFVEDITERKQTESALRTSEERLRAVVANVPLVLFAIGRDGVFTLSEGNGLSRLGLRPGEVVGKSVFDVYRDLPSILENVSKALDGEALHENVRVGDLWFESWYTPVRGLDNLVTGVIGVSVDVTERVHAEEIRERMQAQLLQSKKMEAIGELAGGIAHDFNNMLTGILGNAAIIQESVSPVDPLHQNISEIRTAAQEAAALTKGLLTFSRGAVVQPTPLDTNASVERTLTVLKQSLPSSVSIVKELQQDVWCVYMDQTQMTQILLNLGINSRDAMEGRGTLAVSTRNVAVDAAYVEAHPYAVQGDFVVLSVADTGPGIPPEVLPHVFDPFFTTKSVGSGTGLGLSIVYGATRQAGGWITVQSTPGKGALFEVYLPRSAERQRPVISTVQSGAPRHVGTVLVVEDEPVVCAVVQALLSRAGYQVVVAVDGASALRMLQEHADAVGLILLDMTMPGMTTEEVLAEVRRLHGGLPVLLTSGYVSNDAVTRLMEAGTVQGFLPKPYESELLLTTVTQLMRVTAGESS